MRINEFEQIFSDQVAACKKTLVVKGNEYATQDRLHNFKKAAALTGGTPAQALAGMWVKQIVSVFDLVNSGQDVPMPVWDEKIGDALNYLFLLKAVVIEMSKGNPSGMAELMSEQLKKGMMYPNEVLHQHQNVDLSVPSSD